MEVTKVIADAQRNGVRVSTEAYPYGASSTTIGAPFLSPEAISRSGRSPTDIFVVDTAEWVKDVEDLARIRRERPGAIVIIHYLREDVAADRALLARGRAAVSKHGDRLRCHVLPSCGPARR
jgi:hypothetical protein